MYIDDFIEDMQRVRQKLKAFEGGKNAYIGDQVDALSAILANVERNGITMEEDILAAQDHCDTLIQYGFGRNKNEQSGRFGEYCIVKRADVTTQGWEKGKPVASVNYEPGIVAYPDAYDLEPVKIADVPIECLMYLGDK